MKHEAQKQGILGQDVHAPTEDNRLDLHRQGK